MAETAVSASKGVIGALFEKLTKLVEDKCTNLVGMSKNIVFLKDELPTMSALLEKLEDADELDPVVKAWRNQVREMAYDIEDCIDDFVHHVGGGDVEAGFIDKVSHFLRTLRARLETAEHIKDLKIQLIEINERHKRYKFDLDDTPSSSFVAIDPRLPALYSEAANLVGIEGPREQVIKWLTDADQQIMVLPIVGFGGLGKTTLAKEVYQKIGQQFNTTEFVSVSQRPDVTRFLKGIQSKLPIRLSSEYCEVKDIIDNIRAYLQHRRYLFVVDDLWDAPTWNIIRSVFPENGMGCRIIVTTRSEDVARWVCCNHRRFIYRMEPLSDENSRWLFFNRIFGSEDGCPSQFREISAQILKKCSGLPLAIITIASLLANQPAPHKKEYWESIRNSIGTWGSGTNPTLEGMRQILHLSYKDLPRHLRTCFLYLGIYPEDFTIKKDDLIRQWLAEGFVHHFHGGSSEEVAKSYFNELINRSLIQPEETKYGEVVSCRVHDMMLDLILSRCAEDNFICVAYNLEELSGKHEFKVRRLLVDSRVGDSGDTKISGTPAPRLLQLRSLQLFGVSVSLSLLPLSKYIRVLILHLGKTGTGGNERVDVTAIGQLFQLRYLKIVSLHHALVLELPTEIRGLQYLSTLEIDCTNENSLPSDIVHLSRLSHLIVPSGIGLPDGKIGSMKSLCTLQKIEILDIKSAIGLGELTNLKDLELYSKQALSEREIDALVTSLGKLHKLISLRMSKFAECIWYDEDNRLGSLSNPPLNIERLHLGGWRLRRVPRWINGHLQNLCFLVLDVTEMSTDEVRLLGELPSLSELCLSVKRLAPCSASLVFGAGFPALECLEFFCGGDISHLCFEAGVMPNLRKIILFYIDIEWSGTAPVGIEHLLNKQLRYIQLHPVTDTAVDAERISLAFTEAIRAHTSRGGAEPYLRFARIRSGSLIE
ncbi:disease resistance protein RGA5-like [Oryza sativa Japonica Group]|uniref:disease resistance protein RGA5-like n=1 Tax=Oryza sativa subsp. japonica TaxID=39947 RepID=UPI0007755746|nr:disease resistance protein RGA5-like [Oryza sativa Japonica Group]KAF2918541.1 hypothetical protein DAI22_08g065000 [Oryza sativa Japonica Group]KAF2918542.1 hypothetical protein DAI22_08g065000 [Oryza sativa Japonica Group]